MTTITAIGDAAREILKMGAFGTFKVDGMIFTIRKRTDTKSENVIDIEIGPEP